MSLLIAFGLVCALIQSPVAEQSAAVSGRVVEDGSLKPVAGAQIILLPMATLRSPMPFRFQPPAATTDQDGRYRFATLTPGNYRISVRKSGFAQPADLAFPEVALAPGESREDLDITLHKGAVIVGRVLDESGEPVIEAHVMVLRKPPESMHRIRASGPALMPAGSSALTNDLGEFRVFSLPPGEYYVQAMLRPDFDGSHTPRATTMLPTYFSGTSDAGAAQPIVVAAGQTSADVVIRMVSAASFQISGVIRDERGQPVENTMVRLVVDEPTAATPFMVPWVQSRSDASGKFTINNVTSGSYTLMATAPLVISGRGDRRGLKGGANGGAQTAFVGIQGGTIGGGVMTETRDGTTVEYRDDTATRVPITISAASVSGLEVIVRLPTR